MSGHRKGSPTHMPRRTVRQLEAARQQKLIFNYARTITMLWVKTLTSSDPTAARPKDQKREKRSSTGTTQSTRQEWLREARCKIVRARAICPPLILETQFSLMPMTLTLGLYSVPDALLLPPFAFSSPTIKFLLSQPRLGNVCYAAMRLARIRG